MIIDSKSENTHEIAGIFEEEQKKLDGFRQLYTLQAL